MTNSSILKVSGAFHCVKTSRIRFWAFSYSMGEPCGRSNQLITYFIVILLMGVLVLSALAVTFAGRNQPMISCSRRTRVPSAAAARSAFKLKVKDYLRSILSRRQLQDFVMCRRFILL